MNIHLIAAARPNFMKIAPLYHALKRTGWAAPVIVHTGQHYDLNMSDVFFQDLLLPSPHLHLGVGSGSHGEQTGRVIIAYEKVLIENRPDLVVVVGDVNSTAAAAIAAVKAGVKTAHLEAGLRSFDRKMPEEINRVITDSIVDVLWTPSPDADENLYREGVPPEKVRRVGNIMIDSLEMLRPKIERDAAFQEMGLEPKQYGLVTLHRPSNVDSAEDLKRLASVLARLSEKVPLVFPIHPRTRKNLEQFGLIGIIERNQRLKLVEPLSYIRFMNLLFNCRFALTDSGGIQEESSYLSIPCFTLRPNTERPVTIELGTNRLCRIEKVEELVSQAMKNGSRRKVAIDMWDGRTADRVVEQIREIAAARMGT
jgi:UDP-N-acetylglucosamine 2-epimerase (non-hydrolysing)